MSPYSRLSLIFFVKIYQEGKGCTLANVWVKQNLTTELLGNLLRNVETKSHTFGVQLLWVVKKAKELEKLVMVVLLNSDTSVLNRYFQHTESLRFLKIFVVLLVTEMPYSFNQLTSNCNRPFFRGELECIALQVE